MTDAEMFEGPDLIPVTGLTKGDLAKATGFTPKRIRGLINEGRIPGTAPKTRGGGWSFDLPAIFARLVDAPAVQEDPIAEAKRRKAVAEAQRIEQLNKKIAGELIAADEVRQTVARHVARFRSGILEMAERLPATIPPDVRDLVKIEGLAMIERLNAGLAEATTTDKANDETSDAA